MAATRDSGHTDPVSPTGPRSDGYPSRHDLVLAAIPLMFLVGLLVAVSADLPGQFGLVAGSILSTAPLAYGLFVDPPTGGSGAGAVDGPPDRTTRRA